MTPGPVDNVENTKDNFFCVSALVGGAVATQKGNLDGEWGKVPVAVGETVYHRMR